MSLVPSSQSTNGLCKYRIIDSSGVLLMKYDGIVKEKLNT